MSANGITLRYFDGCPNWQVAQARLDEALERVGNPKTVVLEKVTTAREADDLELRGSPTILIDGVDPFDSTAPTGLSCRVYRTEAGLEGAPSVEQLIAVLKRH